MSRLIMIRHGESEWNRLDLFTGWVDIPLSFKGIQESLEAGKQIAEVEFDVVFVSSLIRAQMTAFLAMSVNRVGRVPRIVHQGEGKLEEWAKIYSKETEERCIPVFVAWELNERMYGTLQGMNKAEMRARFGEEQVQTWRRSFDGAPPEGESLEMTAERAIPYFKERVMPYLKAGKNVLISAHGNSLRSIVMHLDGLTKEEVIRLELATGAPLLYRYQEGEWKKDPSL